MDDKQRYRELKKENDDKLATLIDSYHFIGHNYVLKARGYAENSLDTEARIKDVLDELVDFCEKGMPAPMAIPNTTEYIEGKVSLLAKKKGSKEKAKNIVWTILLISFFASFIIIGLYFRQGNYLEKPSNISHTINGEEITLTWDRVSAASYGYSVYYIENGVESTHMMVEQTQDLETNPIYKCKIDPLKEYKFYIYCNDVTQGENENFVVIYYGSEHTEYIYTPEK